MSTSFFDHPRKQSGVKSQIVAKYFGTWARIVTHHLKKTYPGEVRRIAYIDLFAGPGYYEDGSKSTPILVLEEAIKDSEISNRLVTVFNDANSHNIDLLRQGVARIDGIERLAASPQFDTLRVDQNVAEFIGENDNVPTLLFIDPFGYKGLSLDLINSVLSNFASDCIFFFNYVRINAAITNNFMDNNMTALFGSERLMRMRREICKLSTYERELYVFDEFVSELKEHHARHVQKFCFKKDDEDRTSHYLVLAAKHPKGYREMKEIMAKFSTICEQGVPTYTFDPKDDGMQPVLDLTRPMDILVEDLTKTFAGQTLTRKAIYEQHSIGTRYIKNNYKKALSILESEGRITIQPPAEIRPKRNGEITLAEGVSVTFPTLENINAD